MRIKVEYSAQLRHAVGVAEEDWDLEDGDTLPTLLARVAERHSEALRPFLPSGEFAHLLVAVNDEQAFAQDCRPLCARDTVSLLAPMSGG